MVWRDVCLILEHTSRRTYSHSQNHNIDMSLYYWALWILVVVLCTPLAYTNLRWFKKVTFRCKIACVVHILLIAWMLYTSMASIAKGVPSPFKPEIMAANSMGAIIFVCLSMMRLSVNLRIEERMQRLPPLHTHVH